MAGLREPKDAHRIFSGLHRANVQNAGIAMIAMIIFVALVFLLPKEKVSETIPTTSSTVREIVKLDCTDSAGNPLLNNAYEDVNKVVWDYYTELAKEAEYVEAYTNINVYTKLGPYKDSYIVFTNYEMKIKDIYTTVPGMGTMYIEKQDTEEDLHIVMKVEDSGVNELVQEVAEHPDVQVLMMDVQARYDQAVWSDATLAQALTDLQQAYEGAPKP